MTAMDGLEEAEAPSRPKLSYPCGEPPIPGQARAVAPGVLWVRMPLPFALRWINLWLIEDGDGWALVDTGVGTDETREHWHRVIASALGGRPISRVFVTHMHPDHIGLAGWMTRKFHCRLWISRLEYVSCRMLAADTGLQAPEDGLRFYKEAGWDEDALDSYRVRFGGFGRAMAPLPDSYRRLADGDAIEIGGRIWRVISGSGHSPEHSCLYQPELNVFISGDQLLPRISSNVSVFPTEPDADPLTDWLDSCKKLRAALPEDVLVLPAHNEPFHGAHARLTDLIDGHDRGVDRREPRLRARPRRVVELFGALFARAIGPDLLGMATGETIAHLNCLMVRGRANREIGADGVAYYSAR
jgi:glyoxylase-like metal-dependent hydrolase (beta-lactamase superfamily II)